MVETGHWDPCSTDSHGCRQDFDKLHISSICWWLNQVRLYSVSKILYPKGRYNLTLYRGPYYTVDTEYMACSSTGIRYLGSCRIFCLHRTGLLARIMNMKANAIILGNWVLVYTDPVKCGMHVLNFMNKNPEP